MASQRAKLENAIKAVDFEVGGDRAVLLSLLAQDETEKADRPQPRLPEITFPYRSLPGERNWAHERIPRKEIE